MVLIKDILLGIWQAVQSLVQYFAEHTKAAGIVVDPIFAGVLLGVLTLWLASGCWASSIASSRRHSALLHFLLGLGIPFVYPLIILFSMDIKGAKERAHKRQEDKSKDAAVKAERQRVAGMVGREALVQLDSDEPEPTRVFDAAYFERIGRDEQGNPAGPWRVVFGGSEVKVLRILEPLVDVVSVEIETREGAHAKFRIPYARITECEPC